MSASRPSPGQRGDARGPAASAKPAEEGPAGSAGPSPRLPPNWRNWPAWLATTRGGPVLLLRAFLGVTFTFAGIQKLANRGFFDAHSPGSIQAQLQGSVHATPVGSLLSPLVHLAVPLGIVIALGEIAVGLGTLVGLYARVAAAGGALLALLFFLTVSFNDSPYYYGPDIVFLFAWTPLVIGGAGELSLDAFFERQKAEAAVAARSGGPRRARAAQAAVERRAVVKKLATGGLLASFGVVIAGMAAAIGRMFSKGTAPNTASLGGSGSGSASPGTGTSPGSSATSGTAAPAAHVKGKLLGKASQVPIGGAASFNDPYENGAPGYVVQPQKGEFIAFSAICTHAGCTVQYAKAEQQFQCPCHGSVYSALTGQVLGGPAPSPLPKIPIVESGGDIYVES